MIELQVMAGPVVDRLESAAKEMIDQPWHLSLRWLQERGWVAVPVEKGRHFEPEEAERVAHVLRAAGYQQLYAVATEPMGQHPSCYLLPATRPGLQEFSEETASLNFILLPETCSFAILCTSEDYNIFAGQAGLVEGLIGQGIEAGRADFRELASDEWWQGRLLQVADRYETTGPR